MNALPYTLEYEESCRGDIKKATRKNSALRVALEKKITQILEMPHRFKSLHPPLQNKQRVHIEKSFVLIFEIDEHKRAVILKKFAHHDEAYG